MRDPLKECVTHAYSNLPTQVLPLGLTGTPPCLPGGKKKKKNLEGERVLGLPNSGWASGAGRWSRNHGNRVMICVRERRGMVLVDGIEHDEITRAMMRNMSTMRLRMESEKSLYS